MMNIRFLHRANSWLLLTGLCIPAVHAQDVDPLPIFDTHVHYNADAWESYPSEEIIRKMETARVPRALVSSSPDEGTRRLYEFDPDRIVPFLRPYHDGIDQSNWFDHDTMLEYFRQRLETMSYTGIGEFHLHDIANADSPVVRQTARLAVERDVYLHVHSDAQVVRAILAYEPDAKILWAHAGVLDPPEVVSQMMDEFDNLWIDTSIREADIAPQGKLDPAWQALFLKHPERITVGSDTYTLTRWRLYEKIIELDRGWLDQLPREVAEQIAYRNAVRLFGAGSHTHLQD